MSETASPASASAASVAPRRLLALSFYVTLALACACLAQASMFFIGWMAFLLPATLFCLAAAYRLEGRWSLGADAANRLGVVIMAAAGAWIVLKLPRTEEEVLSSGIPWPAGLLPHLAPLLLVLLIVKVFRTKNTTDFWVLQTIGLMMVTLGCVLAGETLFGLLLFAYFVSLVWCLALFHERRQEPRSNAAAAAGPASLFGPPSPSEPPLCWRALKLGKPLRWTTTAACLGIGLFLAAPRQAGWQWVPHKLTVAAKSLRTGVNIDGGIDLSTTGTLEISDTPAFEVTVFDKNGTSDSLPLSMRWTVDVLDYHERGQWNHYSKCVTPVNLTWGLSSLPEPIEPPDQQSRQHPSLPPSSLGVEQRYFFFNLDPMASGGLVWVDTPEFHDIGLNPHIAHAPTMSCFFYRLPGTDSLFWSLKSRKRRHSYGQLVAWREDQEILPSRNLNKKYERFLLRQDVPSRITDLTRRLLTRVPDLSEEDRVLDVTGRLPPKSHARAARAICNHLRHSGEYRYTLKLRRHQVLEDPTVDFLCNAKEGHCQRFAGGLTLMLRSIGIPARVAIGYLGHEPQGEGRYLIRQSKAHAWVQALVPNEAGEYEWLILDATPETESEDEGPTFWLTSGLDLRPLWRELVLEYSADNQRNLVQAIWFHAANGAVWGWITLVSAMLMTGWLAMRLPRWLPRLLAAVTPDKAGAGQDATFYARFLALTKRKCRLTPQTGQTPLEFAAAVASIFTSRGLQASLVDLPGRFAQLFYRIRFGGGVLSPSEAAETEAQLSALEKALTAPA